MQFALAHLLICASRCFAKLKMWKRTGGDAAIDLPGMPALEQWVREIVGTYYGGEAEEILFSHRRLWLHH